MLKTLTASFLLAFNNIRSHFFHTILSVLGIVIGVAALVAILSLIDGMEQYAKDQITNTTSLKAIIIRSEAYRQIDGVRVRKDSVSLLKYEDFNVLTQSITLPAKGFLFTSRTYEVTGINDTIRTAAVATGMVSFDTSQVLMHGKKFTHQDISEARSLGVISETLSRNLSGKQSPALLLGKEININNREVEVVGILKKGKSERAEVFIPITTIALSELKDNTPTCVLEAGNVEDVPAIKKQVVKFLNNHFGQDHDFVVITNDLRVEQAAKGFMLFRIIMGMIVGISVLVGGIGVMNVLLISVTERTAEIGVRKAVGANKRDIVLQFLSESVTISCFGSLMGLIFGILGTMAFVPIIRSITEVPFQAAYTWNTLIIISVLAVFVGVVFGTYPAMRAAKLDPVEAIRRE